MNKKGRVWLGAVAFSAGVWVLVVCSVYALFSGNARAADCEPASALRPNATGTAKLSGTTPKGEWHNYWCPVASALPGKIAWKQQPFAVLNEYKDASLLSSATVEVLAASSPLTVFNALTEKARVLPPVGTQKRFDWEELMQLACLGLVAAQQVPLDPLPPGYCPPPTPLPVVVPPPPPPPATYAVKALGTAPDRPAYPVVNGVRGTTSTARALAGQPCNTTTRPFQMSGSDVWAEFGPSFAPNLVAVCVKK